MSAASTVHSIVLDRMAVANGYTRMPPLASNELDQTDIALVTNWITQSLPSRQTYNDWRLAQFGNTTSAAGDPAADPDGDGHTNFEEFLAGTNPNAGTNFLSPVPALVGSNVSLSASIPANRTVQVETSTDLANWSLWNTPGNGGIRGGAYPLKDGENNIGRENGDITFPSDGFVSGRHAVLQVAPERLMLRDLGSSNGTFLRLGAPSFVDNGDQFLIGRQLVRVELS